ncbi:Heterokaryon incompatibility protein 6, OR allele [Colletotrichum fructicola]|nr:uncharacterized protein CGMCC3_g1331 [Colletotrichum fructicola]KAE9582166.1 hypothetical protein CGMCC3_g1331 [Colletotrichum fructicola]KAF4899529.1 Heterokaryon incompatibility protein 6, OR allele [Colletotrichum fructicola]KAF4900113.1 Heterokaryon incompatibility protein 6, OR allele [Colletotrichum fructicola]KAF4938736.1 Heterokaryon incompatibility protein 6, OR allele [Colletotrichum fructicola]
MASCLSCGSVDKIWNEISSLGVSNQFIYKALPTPNSIRLLILEPGYFDDPIQCSLYLSSTLDLVDYDAISYTWADENDTMNHTGIIFLESYRLPVTPNCETALKRARSRGTSKVVWIDSVCMNQDDVDERGHQVRLMPQIYSRARQVLIYFGEPSAEEERLFRWMSDDYEPDAPRRPLQATVGRLFKRRYFSRVWIIQEVALARQAMLICGKHQLPWARLQVDQLEAQGILGNAEENPAFAEIQKLPSVLQFRAPKYRDAADLLHLLDLARHCHATDPRDKVFSLFGLISCAEIEGLSADYSKSTTEIFMYIAQWIAQRHGLAAILARSSQMYYHTRVLPPSDKPIWVPSWVPNWAEQTFATMPPMLEKIHEDSRAAFGRVCLPIEVSMSANTIAFPAFRVGSLLEEALAHSEKTQLEPAPYDVYTAKPWPYLTFGTNPAGHISNQNAFVFPVPGTPDLVVPIDADYQPLFDIPGLQISPQDATAYPRYNGNCIFLVPSPDGCEGFSFNPGRVSVYTDGESFKWVHEDKEGREFNGQFSKYAICGRLSDHDNLLVSGLLHMDGVIHDGPWKVGEFERIRIHSNPRFEQRRPQSEENSNESVPQPAIS